MAKLWYCEVMGKEVGPLSSQQLMDMAKSGKITPDNHVRSENSGSWSTADKIKGLFADAVAQDAISDTRTRPPVRTHASSSYDKSPCATNAALATGRSSYAMNSLTKDEHIIYAATIHPLVVVPRVILFGVCVSLLIIVARPTIPATALLLIIFACLCVPHALVTYFCTECVITDKRVIGTTGFFSRNSLELLLPKVEGLQVAQGVFGRIFDYGTVRVVGTGGSATPFPGICNPLEFRRQTQQQIDNTRD